MKERKEKEELKEREEKEAPERLIEREVDDMVEEREKEEVLDVVEEGGGRKSPMLEVTADGEAGAGKDTTLLLL